MVQTIEIWGGGSDELIIHKYCTYLYMYSYNTILVHTQDIRVQYENINSTRVYWYYDFLNLNESILYLLYSVDIRVFLVAIFLVWSHTLQVERAGGRGARASVADVSVRMGSPPAPTRAHGAACAASAGAEAARGRSEFSCREGKSVQAFYFYFDGYLNSLYSNTVRTRARKSTLSMFLLTEFANNVLRTTIFPTIIYEYYKSYIYEYLCWVILMFYFLKCIISGRVSDGECGRDGGGRGQVYAARHRAQAQCCQG